MKKIVLVFVSIISIGLATTSCNKDNDKAEPSIIGKWTWSKSGFGPENSVVLKDYTNHREGCPKNFYQFNEDGSFKDVKYQLLPTPCSEGVTNFSYVKDGTKLTVGGQEATIEILTDTTLKIKNISSGYASVYEFTRQ